MWKLCLGQRWTDHVIIDFDREVILFHAETDPAEGSFDVPENGPTSSEIRVV